MPLSLLCVRSYYHSTNLTHYAWWSSGAYTAATNVTGAAALYEGLLAASKLSPDCTVVYASSEVARGLLAMAPKPVLLGYCHFTRQTSDFSDAISIYSSDI